MNYTPKDSIRFWSKVKKLDPDSCWEWQAGKNKGGYGRFTTSPFHKHLAHRVAFELSTGIDPGKLFVLHKCDNRLCCNPGHLFLGTNQDNVDDRERKGRNNPPRGEKHGNHKLTTEQVQEIKSLYSTGNYAQHEIATMFGIHQTQVCNIVTGKQWGYLP